MLGLIVAGEAVFLLPYYPTRFFRPTVLEIFELTNTELGAAQGIYGIMALFGYFLGGPLADRFPARNLLATSLWTTAAGGLYMATFPDFRGALALWGFFGLTTILLFWAALIRATREWGGRTTQGRAYGLLDGGRGLLGALSTSIAVWMFGLAFPDGYAAANFTEKQEALRVVIYGYTAVTAATGAFVWFVVKEGRPPVEAGLTAWKPQTEGVVTHIVRVMRIRAVWLQAIVILCAYVGYKGFENYSLFAVQGYGVDAVRAAELVTLAAWTRVLAPFAFGMLGDRYFASRMSAIAFVLLLASHLFFALTTPVPSFLWILFGNILVGAAAIYGLRGLYFALLEEAKVPAAVTGTTIGIVSVVGFTPDIFVAYLGGMLLDRSPGLLGHQHYFMFLASFAAGGVVASTALMRLLHPSNRQNRAPGPG